MYTIHPNSILNELFAKRPYQGVAPDKATFLFVGLDANYDAQIAEKPIFNKIVEYHSNAAYFWQKYGVHHPFLLTGYTGGGRFYHKSFANIGFMPEHANLVSFIELLHVPTVGRNVLDVNDLLATHLNMINSIILDGLATHIFLPATVARLMRASGIFKWLPRSSIHQHGPLDVLFKNNNKTVYSLLHFSVYGKFTDRKAAQALAIRGLIPQANENLLMLNSTLSSDFLEN